MHTSKRLPFLSAIFSGRLRISSGVCVFGVMPNETLYSEYGSGEMDIFGDSR